MRKKLDVLETLMTHEHDRLGSVLERQLLRFGSNLSPNDALKILESLQKVYYIPFNSPDEASRFYSRILSNVTKTKVRVEVKSGGLAISLPRANIQLPENENLSNLVRPPFNAEYLLYLLLPREERNEVIGDLIEAYGKVIKRFDKRRADIWFYKQVLGSLVPLLRRQILRIGALVWLGRVLRRLIS